MEKQSNKHSRTENGDDKQREYNSASEDSINGCRTQQIQQTQQTQHYATNTTANSANGN
jgi:hypothetical protein